MSKEAKIGVTGHQARSGLDWSWTRSSIAAALRDAAPVREALTSLAIGTDQVFAEEALRLAIKVKAIIPFSDYARCFENSGLDAYRSLLARCTETVVLERTGSDQDAFLAAGMRVVDECDLLLAVWDGEPAVGPGGTAEVVAHALACGRRVVHLNPFLRTASELTGWRALNRF